MSQDEDTNSLDGSTDSQALIQVSEPVCNGLLNESVFAQLQQLPPLVNDLQTLMASARDFTLFASSRPLHAALNPTMIAFFAELEQNASTICAIAKSLKDAAAKGNFTLFPRLPPELRLKIYECVYEKSMVFELERTPVVAKARRASRVIYHVPLLGILHANRESREAVLNRFPVIISGLRDGTVNPRCHARFHPEKDILYIPWRLRLEPPRYDPNCDISSRDPDDFSVVWSTSTLGTLQNLAIDHKIFKSYRSSNSCKLNLVGFKNLRTFTIVIHEREEEDQEYDTIARCIDQWSVKNGKPVNFTAHSNNNYAKMVEVEVEKFLTKHKEKSSASHPNWQMPQGLVKYKTRDGKRCCIKRTS